MSAHTSSCACFHHRPAPLISSYAHRWPNSSSPMKLDMQRIAPRTCEWRIPAVDKDQIQSISQTESDVEVLESKLGIGRRARRDRSKMGAGSLGGSRPQSKEWDSMTLAEKAWEIYIGEKGVLFWLNKLAFVSIFVVIGSWIAFRFVGPGLGWYQLESPLLPPSQVYSGAD
eukprot:c24536_g1_i2 orf=300-812(+)